MKRILFTLLLCLPILVIGQSSKYTHSLKLGINGLIPINEKDAPYKTSGFGINAGYSFQLALSDNLYYTPSISYSYISETYEDDF
ncbi:MAG: hypothetical protein H8E84_01375 [Flavobacteriales bacterium]|nr:hypothetical protein [Flavobacteriales bacterium]